MTEGILLPPFNALPLRPDGQWSQAWLRYWQGLADRVTAIELVNIAQGANEAALLAAATTLTTRVSAVEAADAALNTRVTALELIPITLGGSPSYANDVAAAAGGVPIGGYYRNGSFICERIT